MNGIVISQQSSVLLDLAQKQNEIYFDQFVGEEKAFRECIELLYGGEIDINMTSIGTILKFAVVNKIVDMYELGFNWVQQNLTSDNLYEMINKALIIEKIGYVPDRSPTWHTLLDWIKAFIQNEIEDDLFELSKNWGLRSDNDFIKFLIDDTIINYSLPVLTARIENDADIKLVIDELDAKGIELCLSSERKKALKLLDRMSDKVESLETSKRILVLQKGFYGSRAAGNDPDKVDKKLWIPKGKCGMLTGPKGATLEVIQKRTNTSIVVNKVVLIGKCLVTISGNDKDCLSCSEFIETLLRQEGVDSNQSYSQNLEMWIDSSKVGVLIDEKCCNIEAEFSVLMDIKTDIVLEGQTLITLIGAERSAMAAMQHIYDYVELDFSAPEVVSGTASGVPINENSYPTISEPCSQSNDTEGTWAIWIPTSKIGLVIGRRGSNIRRIKRSYGLEIDITRIVRDCFGYEETQVVITGLMKEAMQARDYIDELIESVD